MKPGTVPTTTPRRCAALLLAATFLAGVTVRAADEEDVAPPPPVRIGMVNTLFRDVPQPLMMAMMQPFGALMKAMTGVTGELVPGGGPMHLGKQLADGQVQLGVFHGVEFAWVRLKHPELQPLMIAVNQHVHLRCHLVVRDDNKAQELADLKGKVLALPRGTREHARLFLQRNCRLCGQEAKALFAKITTPGTTEDALDDVVDDEAQATIVDGVVLDCYKRRKPSRYARLKTLVLSEVFPAGVVVYHPGTLDSATVQRFRTGMINANKDALGKQMLTLWKLTGFEPVPDDYEATLTNIVKAYPPPAGK
jgi:ABC-type phosphate/phosphonate transport system substrate-binding protein